jgi:hypothetical protein
MENDHDIGAGRPNPLRALLPMILISNFATLLQLRDSSPRKRGDRVVFRLGHSVSVPNGEPVFTL